MKTSTLISIGFLVMMIAVTLSSFGEDMKLMRASNGQVSKCTVINSTEYYVTFMGIKNHYQVVTFYHDNYYNEHTQTIALDNYCVPANYLAGYTVACWSSDFSNKLNTILIQQMRSVGIQTIIYIVITVVSHIFIIDRHIN